MLDRKHQSIAVAGREERVFAGVAAAPERPHRMNDVPGRQAIGSSDPRLARWAPPECPAFRRQLGPRRPVDRAINSAAAKARENMKAEMSRLTGGLELPGGLSDLLGQGT